MCMCVHPHMHAFVCVYVCALCVCVYTYIHTYIYIYIYKPCVSGFLWLHNSLLHVLLPSCTPFCPRSCVLTVICIFLPLYKSARVHADAFRCIKLMDMYVCVYIYIVCVCVWPYICVYVFQVVSQFIEQLRIWHRFTYNAVCVPVLRRRTKGRMEPQSLYQLMTVVKKKKPRNCLFGPWICSQITFLHLRNTRSCVSAFALKFGMDHFLGTLYHACMRCGLCLYIYILTDTYTDVVCRRILLLWTFSTSALYHKHTKIRACIRLHLNILHTRVSHVCN
jgi:hypothetical protein